jgi:16S rRNA (guanine(966)-N(2))-methyltransferase RsmD
MRIIAGDYKGRKLADLPKAAIRPTADRLREAIFNILEAQGVTRPSVLDLFAGSGALGLEALSRGAHQAVFVDSQVQALKLIQRNLDLCGCEAQRWHLIKWDIRINLNCLRSLGWQFDLVFIDPPYQKGLIRPTLEHLIDSQSLDPRARIVVEHARQETIDVLTDTEGTNLERLGLYDCRHYGKTLVSFFQYMV